MTGRISGEARAARSDEGAGPPSGGPAASRADVCAGRAAVYEALTYGFSEPTAGYVEALESGEVVALVRGAVGCLHGRAAAYEPALTTLAEAGSKLNAAGGAPGLRGLRVEYARLFTGPGQSAIMCYASQYLDADGRGPGGLNGSAAAFAEAAYKKEGVSTAPGRGELPDHVTTELEFLFHLCRREEVAWAADDRDEAARLRCAQDAFLHGHAGRWLPSFAALVRSRAVQPAYVAMAELLGAHLELELGDAVTSGVASPGS